MRRFATHIRTALVSDRGPKCYSGSEASESRRLMMHSRQAKLQLRLQSDFADDHGIAPYAKTSLTVPAIGAHLPPICSRRLRLFR